MVNNQFHEIANLFIRTMFFEKAGDFTEDQGHVHTYDHAHFVSKGGVKVEVNGVQTDYLAPGFVYIMAGHVHKMTALYDDTVSHCIHALRSQDLSGEPLDPAIVPEGVSAFLYADPINKPG
jgi:quercetin dioxygenase-like cupin family protein